jgi:ADP-ribose pyrophosphatase
MNEGEGEKILCEGKFLRLMRRGTWEYCERMKISGIVGIAGVTDEGKLLLVEQYRIPLGKSCIELPAGLAGDIPGEENEDMVNAAGRELLEETGYSASSIRFICEGPPSAGSSTEMIRIYLATGLERTGDGGGDASEEIVLHEIPVVEVPKWLKEQERLGKLVDLRIYTALFFITNQHDS